LCLSFEVAETQMAQYHLLVHESTNYLSFAKGIRHTPVEAMYFSKGLKLG